MVQAVTYQSDKQSVYFQGKLIVLENLTPILSPEEKKKRKREIEYKQEMGALVVRKCNTLSDLLTEYVSLYGKEKWALSTYEGNVGLIRNYIEPMVGSVKLSEINTRFMEKYYQGLLQTKAVGNPVKGNRKMNLFLRVLSEKSTSCSVIVLSRQSNGR